MGRTAEAVEMIFTKLLTSYFTTSTAVIIFVCPAGAVTLRTTLSVYSVTERLPSLGLVLGITYQTSSPTVCHHALSNDISRLI